MRIYIYIYKRIDDTIICDDINVFMYSFAITCHWPTSAHICLSMHQRSEGGTRCLQNLHSGWSTNWLSEDQEAIFCKVLNEESLGIPCVPLKKHDCCEVVVQVAFERLHGAELIVRAHLSSQVDPRTSQWFRKKLMGVLKMIHGTGLQICPSN